MNRESAQKILFVLLGFGLMIGGIAWIGYRYLRTSRLRAITADEAGLIWQECLVSGGFAREQVAECTRLPMLMPLGADATDRVSAGEPMGDVSEDLSLTIGEKTYRAVRIDSSMSLQECYTLYQDQTSLYTLCGLFTTHSPNISLQAVGGQVAWEFADHRLDTIIYDGQDLRTVYGLDGAYRPYNLGNKLIFVGKKDGKYFIMYDGLRVGPDYDEIAIAYCCEPVLWSVQFGQGKYLFWARRDGQSSVVKISKR